MKVFGQKIIFIIIFGVCIFLEFLFLNSFLEELVDKKMVEGIGKYFCFVIFGICER